MLVSLENGDLKMITDRIIHLGNFGPCIDVATLVSDYLVMCGDGCDGGVRRMTVDTDFKVNLKLRLVLENFSPVSSFDYDPNEQELFLCSGIGKSGALRRLQLSVPIHTLSRTGSIFVGCNRIWSLKTKISNRHHSFLVISYIDSTTSVLAVDQSGNHLTDNTAEHGLLLQQATIAVGLLIENVPAQVHSEGIRIANLSDKPGVVPKTADWVFPAGTKVNTAVVVEGAIYVAYIAADKGPQITRFELSDGALVESCTQRLKHEVSCMEPFAEKSALVLGTRSPSLEIREVVRLEMLREYPLSNWNLLPQLPQQKDPAILQQLKPTQRTPGIPESVCVHVDEAGPTVVASLRGGMLVTWTIRDGFTLEHKQTKFIDFSSGQLIHARLESSPALILLSERLWLVRFKDGRISCDPTSLKEADAVVPFSLPELGSCLIVISKGALLITKPRRTLICTKKILLRATPRRVLLEQGPDGRKIFIVATYEGGSRHESRIRVFDYETNEQVCASMRIPSSIVNAIISWNGFIVAGLSVEDSRADWIEPFWGNRTGNFRMKQPGRLMFLKIDRQDPSEERTYPPYVLREMYRQNSLFANTGEVFALAVHAQTGRLLVGMHNVLVICSEDGENAPRLNLGPFFRGKIVSMSFFGETLAVCDEKDSVELFCFAPSTISLVPLFRDVQRRVRGIFLSYCECPVVLFSLSGSAHRIICVLPARCKLSHG
uniref:RSE1/DDB1/CPSF1 second beta-propeller domain-containing protein n=1 Tax=Rhodosorus marinus TaxID=101924 RepID=A0A7S2ZT41_9RHOD|mmetsp:Transcript_3025/g.14303  ORF Transcript_3025/g.14303 Transcript_3025/m.14303 type:complete len:717 (+) Transcript_3025:1556-3706(+)